MRRATRRADLKILFELLREKGLKINPSKLFIDCESVVFVGIHYHQDGHQPTDPFVQKCLSMNEPKDPKDVKTVCAMFRFLDAYTYDQAGTMALIAILEANNQPWKWGDEQKEAFKLVKQKINRKLKLTHPSEKGRFILHSDASLYAGAIALFQQQQSSNQTQLSLSRELTPIIKFGSELYNKTIRGMDINKKELYTGANGMKKNVDLLQRDPFIWVTDSQTAKYAVDANVDHPIELSTVVRNIRLTIAQFDFECKHVNGIKIPLVDALSRIGIDGSVQELRNKFHRNKLIKKSKYRKNNKDYYKLSMKLYLNSIHLLSDDEIRDVEFDFEWYFKSNDDYFNYKKAKFARSCAAKGARAKSRPGARRANQEMPSRRDT
jgi:hypothetical protein